jgi:hypothetical protein
MADKKIFEDNIKRLIRSAGAEQKMPDGKKSQILNELTGHSIESRPAGKIPTWKSILNNPAAKLAAAAVIFLVIAVLFVHKGPNEQRTPDTGTKTVSSPAEMTTFLAMSLACKKGGLEGLEEHCDKTAKMLAAKPVKITLKEMLEEMDNHKSERKEL